MAKKNTKKIHEDIVKEVKSRLRSNGYRFLENGAKQYLIIDNVIQPLEIKGTINKQGDHIYLEYWNNQQVAIWNRPGPAWFAYYINDQVIICKWKELKDAALVKLHELTSMPNYYKETLTSCGYLFPIKDIPNARIY